MHNLKELGHASLDRLRCKMHVSLTVSRASLLHRCLAEMPSGSPMHSQSDRPMCNSFYKTGEMHLPIGVIIRQ